MSSTRSNLETEAINLCERLVSLLPSPENLVRLALLYRKAGRLQEALTQLEKVHKQRYVTRRTALLHASLLLQSNLPSQAVATLAPAVERYPGDYDLALLYGTALHKDDRIYDAITIWESLARGASSTPDLLITIADAYMQLAVKDEKAASKAFDYYVAALDLDPSNESIPPKLVTAGLASDRAGEAWSIIGKLDLHQSRYLRPLSLDETLRLLREATEHQEALHNGLKTGLIPFVVFAEHMPRSPWYLWLARTHIHRMSSPGTAAPDSITLVGVPSFAEFLVLNHDTPAALLLDLTALLTLAVLDAPRELLGMLADSGLRLFLPAGTLVALETEIARLRADQLPAYRRRYESLLHLLRAARESAEIANAPSAVDPSLTPLGRYAIDATLALDLDAYFVDDYLPVDTPDDLGRLQIRGSSDLAASLVRAGVLSEEEAASLRQERLGHDHAATFRDVDLSRRFVFSLGSLLKWMDADLLERLLGSVLVPIRIVIGPVCWHELNNHVLEGNMYRLALARAEAIHQVLLEFVASSTLTEAVRLTTQNVSLPGLDPDVAGFLEPALSVFAQSARIPAVIWADDVFMRQALDPRGLLPDVSWAQELHTTIRRAFPDVKAVGVQAILAFLTDRGLLSSPRRAQLEDILYLSGYRILNPANILAAWLTRIPYDPDSPGPLYQLLFSDLGTFENYLPDTIGRDRRRLFTNFARAVVSSTLIQQVWFTESPLLSGQNRRLLSERLLSIFEETTASPTR